MEEHRNVYPQSAAIPFRFEDHLLQILLITNRQRKRWIVPKGIVEEWQSPSEAALEEAFEEAGVRGVIVGDSVGLYEYEKWGGTCRVEVFLMRVDEVHDSWPESEYRDRIWVNIDEAVELVSNPDLSRVIRNAVRSMK